MAKWRLLGIAWCLLQNIGCFGFDLASILGHQPFLQPFKCLLNILLYFVLELFHIDWRLSGLDVVIVDLQRVEQSAETVVVRVDLFIDCLGHGLHNLLKHFFLGAGNLQVDLVEARLFVLPRVSYVRKLVPHPDGPTIDRFSA